MKSRLFNIAWSIVGQFGSFSEALAHAWKIAKLQFALCTQALVNFSYRKVDGSIREAVGSLQNPPMPKGGMRKVNHSILTYFDLQQQDWRCAKVLNLIFS
ncbi:SH3 beta-barrel fold-containing protein [Mucilaginibacter sp. UR6-11]|uniref:SH3 beta-barrel fold-containing protein n=1 Tax=Mucilaginibacter sp. UR6-11 TaxID=1435644 RepID=UPI001E423142|nr:SH3 beta-barrel fold-containing protein [Mucilaginibacter sp. UR6-11]MCC8426946.1 SH3 beta-barrel fold-containing protein [Mucilaginibacter sp. UR6-11]